MACKGIITLCENAGAGNQAEKQSLGGGRFLFTAEGTFGGGSAKLQFKTKNGTWVDYPSGSLSAAGSILVYLTDGGVRAVTATGSAFYCYLAHCPEM